MSYSHTTPKKHHPPRDTLYQALATASPVLNALPAFSGLILTPVPCGNILASILQIRKLSIREAR